MKKILLDTPLGYKIVVTEFLPKTEVKACVLITSATGVKQTSYYKFAQFLSDNGYALYTSDYGGIGESKTSSLKTFDTSASHWATNDTETLLMWIKKTYPDKKLYAIGHSIGGQLLGITPSNHILDGILLVASQTGYWKMWSGIQKYSMFLLWYLLMPLSIKIKGYFPGKLLGSSEDLPKSMALQWRSWCMSPNYLFDKVADAHQLYQQVSCPMYSISAEDDKFAPKNVVDWISHRYSNATLTRVHLMPQELGLKSIGHFGYFRSSKRVVWEKLLAYLECLNKAS